MRVVCLPLRLEVTLKEAVRVIHVDMMEVVKDVVVGGVMILKVLPS